MALAGKMLTPSITTLYGSTTAFAIYFILFSAKIQLYKLLKPLPLS
jgi:hypothetical protein